MSSTIFPRHPFWFCSIFPVGLPRSRALDSQPAEVPCDLRPTPCPIAVFLAEPVSPGAPDFPKPEGPTPQATFKTKVSRVKIGGNVRKSLLLNGEPVEVDTTVEVVFSLVE